MTLENILADFQLLDDWEDRYRYVIELGRALPPLPEAARTEANKVRGCASQVWLATEVNGATAGAAPRLSFKGDSDAHIVRGLIAILGGRPEPRTAPTNNDPLSLFNRHCHVNRKLACQMTMAATVHAATVAWRHVSIA
jgi:cysteine desulfuration protein SufE